MSFSGSSHQKFAKGIAERLGLQVLTFINIVIFIVIIKMSTIRLRLRAARIVAALQPGCMEMKRE